VSTPDRPDPVAGTAFFRDAAWFACTLAPPVPGDPRRSALVAFAFTDGESALGFARSTLGRHHAMVVERMVLGHDAWPHAEPPFATFWTVEREGFVVLAPSIEARAHMPPEPPHHTVQLVASVTADEEKVARRALADLGTCGMLGCVRTVMLGESHAEVDAVVGGPDGLRAGWFP
jgi:hypothetical protein